MLECIGYKKLLAAVENDEKESPGFHDYRGKLEWIVATAESYAEATGLDAGKILDVWEKNRNYWYMNYYQESRQPDLSNDDVFLFDTQEDLMESIKKDGFRCPMCKSISKSPYVCDSGAEMQRGKICDWKVYGLFGDLGRGCFIFVKDKMFGERIFMPKRWEGKDATK